MNRFLLLSFLIYGLILTGLAALNGGLLALAIPLVIYLGLGLLDQPGEVRLKASRRLAEEQFFAGEPLAVEISVTNEGPDLAEVLIEDVLPPSLDMIEGETRLMTALPSGATAELAYRVRGRRGIYQFPGIRVTTGETLGLFKKQVMLEAPGRFLIMPDIVRLRRIEIRPRQTRVYSGHIPAHQGGPGVEFFGVRTYQPGDPLRWINSRATARHWETIYINEFEQERIADVGLILDAREQSNVRSPAGPLFEHSIRATAALADAFLNAGNRVGLFIYGRWLDWTLPGYGKIQRERILRALARARPGEGHVFEKLAHLPARLFPARSQLVFVSPLLAHDADELVKLRARGYRLLVISPDPIAFEQQRLVPSQETALATRLARLERNCCWPNSGTPGPASSIGRLKSHFKRRSTRRSAGFSAYETSRCWMHHPGHGRSGAGL
jgi:uncharacterized protein (DUF58 family)